MRSLLLLLAGALIGALAAFSTANALRQRSAWPRGVMAVMQHHLGELRRLQRSGSCPPQTSAAHLQRLGQVGQDIGPSQPGEAADYHDQARHFVALTAGLGAAPPPDCKALDAPLQQIADACQNCHRDYR